MASDSRIKKTNVGAETNCCTCSFISLFLDRWSFLFLANFQAVPQQSTITFYSLASLKFINSALILNPRGLNHYPYDNFDVTFEIEIEFKTE